MADGDLHLKVDVTLPGFLEFDLTLSDRKSIDRVKRKALRQALRQIKASLDRYIVAGDGVIYNDEQRLSELGLKDGDVLYVQPG